jgi:hypothetical protein
VCDSLGVKADAQREKLKSKPWACTSIIDVQDSTGRVQELAMVDLESLPLWLATIDSNRVAELVRPKLVDYQKECARVLRDHFLKPKGGDLIPVVATICNDILKPIFAVIQAKGWRSSAGSGKG